MHSCVPYFGVGVSYHLVDSGGVLLRKPAKFPHLLAQVPGLLLKTAQLVIRLRGEVEVWRYTEGLLKTGAAGYTSPGRGGGLAVHRGLLKTGAAGYTSPGRGGGLAVHRGLLKTGAAGYTSPGRGGGLAVHRGAAEDCAAGYTSPGRGGGLAVHNGAQN